MDSDCSPIQVATAVEPGEKVPISGDGFEEKKEGSMEEEVSEVNVSVDSLKIEAKGEQVLCGGMVGEERNHVIESELGQKIDVMEEETLVLKKGDVGIQVLQKTQGEEKADDVTVVEIQAKPQEVDDVANEAPVGESSASTKTVMDDVKEDVQKDPEKSVGIHVPEAVEEVGTDAKYGIGSAGEVGQTLDETRQLSELLLAKGDQPKIAQVSYATLFEDEEKVYDTTDLAEDVETNGDSSVAVTEEGMEDMETTETHEETVVGTLDGTKIAEETETGIENEDMTDVPEDVENDGFSSVAVTDKGRKADEEMKTTEFIDTHEEIVMPETGDEENKTGDEPSYVTLYDNLLCSISSEFVIPLAFRGCPQADQVKSIERKEQDKESAQLSFDDKTSSKYHFESELGQKIVVIETETGIQNEDMTDVENDGFSSVAVTEEGREADKEMETTELIETHEEILMAETGEEENKKAGAKRKRVNSETDKKEEDVCLMCSDGAGLVLCDRRGCPQAYHPACVDRDEELFRSKGKWNCRKFLFLLLVH